MIDSTLLDLLVCPVCGDASHLHADEAAALLVCNQCQRGYPVRDGIPVMLIEEAVCTQTPSPDIATDDAATPA